MKKAYSMYIFGLLLFGSNGVIASFIMLTSYQIVLFRGLLGSLVLLAIFFGTGHKVTAHRHPRDAFFITLSGIAMAANWMLIFEAYKYIGVGLTMIINYFGPAIVIMVSPIFFKEKLYIQKIIAVVAALTGVVLISGNVGEVGGSIWGLSCAVASALAYALLIISNKKSVHIIGFENAVLQLLVTTITLVIFTASTTGLFFHVPSNAWLPIIIIGVVNTGLACFLYFASIGYLPVQSVAIIGYLEPVSAAIFGAIFLGESLTALQVLGAVLILGGALYGELSKRSRPPRLPDDADPEPSLAP